MRWLSGVGSGVISRGSGQGLSRHSSKYLQRSRRQLSGHKSYVPILGGHCDEADDPGPVCYHELELKSCDDPVVNE